MQVVGYELKTLYFGSLEPLVGCTLPKKAAETDIWTATLPGLHETIDASGG